MGFIYHVFTKHGELLETKDAARAQAINLFGIVVTLCCIIYVSIFINGSNYIAALSVGFLALICVFPIILNVLGLYRTARYIYTFQAPFFIFFYSQLFGKDLGIQIFLIITFAFPFIFLKSSEKKLILIFFIYNSILVLLMEFVSFPFFPEIAYDYEVKSILKFVVYLTGILFAGVLFFIFFKAIKVTEQDLLDAKLEAEKASSVRKEFLATMSHEIRTPLNAVITIASMLEDSNDSEKGELIKSLQVSSKILLNIINDVLEFSKLEAGKISLHYKPTNIERLMTDLKKTYLAMAEEKGLDFKLNFDQSISASLEADEVRLGQIMGNLIGNAIKFTEKGRIDITVKKTKEQDGEETILFSVKDTGMGIREEELGMIFDSFSQSSMNVTRKFGGTGLGLAIVRKLLVNQNSNIEVKSEYLKGTEFSFELIMKKALEDADALKEGFHKIDLASLSILVVEDHDINALITQKLLVRWGAKTELAKNGYQAVEKAANNSYDLILMDIHMPDMDGYEAARQIRLLGNSNSTIPIFAFSADVMVNQAKTATKYFDGVLSKPIDQEHFYKAIAAATTNGKNGQ